MKVKEIIKQLEKYDPEARVYTSSHDGKGIDEILTCIRYVDSGDIILENEHEFDVSNEIDMMLAWYYMNGYDEIDTYQEMVDRGYTPDLVEKYNETEAETHVMRTFCKEHGIE